MAPKNNARNPMRISSAEKLEPKGVAPVVWIFNELTGNNERKTGAFYPPRQTKARSLVRVEDTIDGSLVLRFDLILRVTIEFPAVLVKILPSSKEKMEEQGSTSILKTVSKDIEMAMQVAYDAFIEQFAAAKLH